MHAMTVAPALSLSAAGAGTLTLVSAAAGAARTHWLHEQAAAAAPASAQVHHLDCRLRCGGPFDACRVLERSRGQKIHERLLRITPGALEPW